MLAEYMGFELFKRHVSVEMILPVILWLPREGSSVNKPDGKG